MPKSVGEDLSRTLAGLCEKHRLTEAELALLQRRIWCRTVEKKTLSEIADELRISRETARTVEQSAMDKLASPALIAEFKAVLDSRTQSILKALAGDEAVFRRESLRARQSCLPADDVFLISVAHGSIENWLDAQFMSDEAGWHLPPPELGPSRIRLAEPQDVRRLSREEFQYVLSLIELKERLQSKLGEVNGVLRDYTPHAGKRLRRKLQWRKSRFIRAEGVEAAEAAAGVARDFPPAPADQRPESSAVEPPTPVTAVMRQNQPEKGNVLGAAAPRTVSPVDPEKSLRLAKAFLGIDE